MAWMIIETLRSMQIVLQGFSVSSSFTGKIFAEKSTVSPAAVESFGVSQAEDKAAEPSAQHFSSALLSLLR